MSPLCLHVEVARGVSGSDRTSGSLFSYVDLEARVPATHPLRTMRALETRFSPRGMRRSSGFTRAPDANRCGAVMPEACFQHDGTLIEAWASLPVPTQSCS